MEEIKEKLTEIVKEQLTQNAEKKEAPSAATLDAIRCLIEFFLF